MAQVPMRRREFITLLGGAAAAWPLAARAQQADGMRRIGFLGGGTVSLRPIYNGLLQGMRELGYWEGKDFVVEWRLAEGQYERFTEFAAEMVRLKVEVSVRRAIQKRSKRAVIAFSYRLFVAAHPRRSADGRIPGPQHALGIARRHASLSAPILAGPEPHDAVPQAEGLSAHGGGTNNSSPAPPNWHVRS
jgi:hypothetical protein